MGLPNMDDMRQPPPPPPNDLSPAIHPNGIQLTRWQDIDLASPVFNVFVTDLDAEGAAYFLKHDTNNRPERANNTADLNRAIEKGIFGTVPDCIGSTPDYLISGRHRCKALAATATPENPKGKTIRIGVMVGLLPSSRHITDRPAAWTAANSLRHEGHDDPNTLAGLVGAIWRLEEYADVRKGGGAPARIAMPEVLSIAGENPQIARYLEVAKSVNKKIGNKETITVIGLCLWWFAKGTEHPGAALEFWRLVETGVGLDAGDPPLVLKDKFVSHSYEKKSGPEYQRVGMIIRAWNAWVKGEKLGSLALHPLNKPLPEVLYPGPHYPVRLTVPAPLEEDLIPRRRHHQDSLLGA